MDLRQRLATRGPLADTVRLRFGRMVMTTVLLGWIGTRLISLSSDAVLPAPGEAAPPPRSESTTDSGDVMRPEDSAASLRDDLFGVPRPSRTIEPKKPRTNPMELLETIELQGVMGGDRPRAMMMYRKTQETVIVSEGDGLGEFEVIEIRERGVVLKWREELFELSL